jgi:hypothetical protein
MIQFVIMRTVAGGRLFYGLIFGLRQFYSNRVRYDTNASTRSLVSAWLAFITLEAHCSRIGRPRDNVHDQASTNVFVGIRKSIQPVMRFVGD